MFLQAYSEGHVYRMGQLPPVGPRGNREGKTATRDATESSINASRLPTECTNEHELTIIVRNRGYGQLL